MTEKEKSPPDTGHGPDLHARAEPLRNPASARLREIASEYAELLRGRLPDGSVVELGGSLASNTSLGGHNDIDLRVLLPKEHASEQRIREISALIADIVPFQKDRPVGELDKIFFAVMHQQELSRDGIEGVIEIEVSVRPAENYVGFAGLQATLPEALLDQYVVFKESAREDKARYKKIKEQFYAMSRWLYAQRYWDKSGTVVGAPELLDTAKKMFWGDSVDAVIAKPKPDI